VGNYDRFHRRIHPASPAGNSVHGASAAEMIVRPWGERSFYAFDPFGNGLCFVDEKTVFTGW
jgi:hypothetical protein